MVALVSRTGREFQRYSLDGRRLVVGCIPYRFKKDTTVKKCTEKSLELLVITSQKGHGLLFPKGGWENDESIRQAVRREALEEAGVRGKIKKRLGIWSYKSKSQDICHEGYMYPLLVEEQLDLWPEKQTRQRKWVSVVEVRENCLYPWMKEALNELVKRLSDSSDKGSLSL